MWAYFQGAYDSKKVSKPGEGIIERKFTRRQFVTLTTNNIQWTSPRQLLGGTADLYQMTISRTQEHGPSKT